LLRERTRPVPKYRGSITLKAEIAALLESSNFGIHALILDDQGVVQLLKAAIEREGSISAFAKRHGLGRSYLSNVLNGKRPVSSPLVRALGFRKVYAPQHDN
jgi:hypothetical protein